ncbi:hypothetical protein [Kineosporia sp. NBRC 101731]|uniref:hypothetical protein n=1 Tax=Kineosporia sp. NBRC 101731 TaxID=3032199 RepID=UPI0024A35CB4|nr:hypothetical protein [Kineosporia sp. NBRC 101731]GLY28947.1 hypothetical protein Kisp02_23120 [Kineosporia sp. NBRC 101731]
MAQDTPGPGSDDTDAGQIPRGAALPRLSADDVPEVRPSGVVAPDASPVLVLEDTPTTPPPAESETTVVPRSERTKKPLNRPLIGGAVAVVVVVAALGLVVPRLMNNDADTTLSMPDGGSDVVIPQDPSPTPTTPAPSPTKTKGDKSGTKDAEKAPVKHTTSTTAATTSAAPGGSSGSGKGDTQGSGASGGTGSTRTSSSTTTTTTKAAEIDWGTYVVHGGGTVGKGEYWETNRIKFGLSSGGRPVLIDENGKTVWSADATGDSLAFQGDGNLVLYSGSDYVWATATMDQPGAILTLQADGNVTIALNNTALWSAR